MKALKIFIAIALLSTSAFGVDKMLKSLPLRTSLIAKIDLDAIKKINFVNTLLNDSSNIKIAEIRSAIQSYAGLDIMKIQQLWVVAGTENEFMFIARGGFDTLPVESALRKLNKYGEIKVDGVHFAGLFDDDNKPGKKNMIAILDDKTVLLGEPKFGQNYLEVFTGKQSGLGAKALKIVQSVEKSKNLVHAKTVNVFVPADQAGNPFLTNLEHGEMVVDQNSKYLTARIDADLKDRNAGGILKIFLDEALKKAKANKDPKQNPVVTEGLKHADVKTGSKGLVLQTKFSLTTLELIAEDQLNGLEAIFE
ncbi:MAG: hypothetical protein NE327_06510 [Lentisphaeraceae bacterium]|nr:hypothetical protein [Lentisphaeraceae bacterium]